MALSEQAIKRATYPECEGCPFFFAQECLIAPSRILLYYFCPAKKARRAPDFSSSGCVGLPEDQPSAGGPALAHGESSGQMV
jgi:hypothetical protein